MGKIACAMLAALLGMSSMIAQVSLTPELEEVQLDADQMRMHLDIWPAMVSKEEKRVRRAKKGGCLPRSVLFLIGI